MHCTARLVKSYAEVHGAIRTASVIQLSTTRRHCVPAGFQWALLTASYPTATTT